MNLDFPINEDVTFTGKTTFSDLIIGVGYRQQLDKHNLTGYLQPGIRFYGYPIFTTEGNEINLDYDSRNIGLIRYSIGYEYELTPKLFLAVEALVGQRFKSKDFWSDSLWSYGFTVGLSAPLF
ncbi:MAG: hypothetical protein AAF598_12375 [Bacteroidota bacterium]